MRLPLRVLTAGGAALALVAPAFAQGPGSQRTREFVSASAQSDQFEIDEAVTALAQSENPDVRGFATRMIEDHRKTSQALADAVSRSKLAAPPPGIGGDQSMFLSALQSARGSEFDRLYARQQVLAHHAALVTVEVYAASGDDPNLRAVAADTSALIQSHSAMADQLAAKMEEGQARP
ncbi:DUF4142 domain-containing protein [Sphingomonas immobilis]|uniref:DUF4142 domain-containing protein n=1 Tax=Sphingomonas immobilis TaxID=3063997 RepID=A0ABT8ZWM1_9SPHN|nr:DUF4142 domain-containing protein [Sphingomonas sp. CA1-15]MDO7841944.1 DUF4142 domain-containing protein [Sphingomonas sp. CA1-15]